MEIMVINESKLKVTLCEEDLKRFEIRASELDYSNTETKRMFWDILNRAKHETGFDTDGRRVLVQLYPSKDGGCEMFVTKMGSISSTAADDEDDIFTKRDERKNRLQKNKNSVSLKPVYSVYAFERNEWLIKVCRRLMDIGYIGESSAYSCDDGKCYLFLSDISSASYIPLDEFSFILEYGKRENPETMGYYVSEYGKAICEKNAVSLLGRL